MVLSSSVTASGFPTSKAATTFHFPKGFLRQAFCIHRYESVNWHLRNYPYSGGMQFEDGTWNRWGGIGIASQWSIREQVYRAYLVVTHDGNWHEWPNSSRSCHLW